MAVKNILNEEQYKRLEKYIIKLQVISNKRGSDMVGKSGVINELECLCMNAADACECDSFQ